jgi:hypothetical protein
MMMISIKKGTLSWALMGSRNSSILYRDPNSEDLAK